MSTTIAQPDMTKQFQSEVKALQKQLTKAEKDSARQIKKINDQRGKEERAWRKVDKKLASQVKALTEQHTSQASAIQQRIDVLKGRLSA
jgi:gas vesicle protein